VRYLHETAVGFIRQVVPLRACCDAGVPPDMIDSDTNSRGWT
jgi:hypothetical protein